ncbi:MAG TPA: YtxH domain-containing protein [Terriglobales bacterium]|nr:YtxH domain-containing protein [Terriglobales bacterium]
MKNFLAGLGIGVGLGVLFAPMRGDDARQLIAKRAGEMADTARDQYQQVRDKTQATMSALREDTLRTGTER